MSNPIPDDKALRKAWLKRKFGSFEYHEEMLRLHRQWANVLRKALARAEQDDSPNRPDSGYETIADEARNFRATTMPIIDSNDDLGKYRKDEWHKNYATATFRSMHDYNRYLLSEGDMLQWLTPDEDDELCKYWGPMSQMATNIRRTVDDTWAQTDDDVLLNERYTGPIDWPPNWREEILAAQGIVSEPLRVKAGVPVPQAGTWKPIDSASTQTLRVQAGEALPDLRSAYGITLWERVGD